MGIVWRRPELDEKIYNYDANNELEFQEPHAHKVDKSGRSSSALRLK